MRNDDNRFDALANVLGVCVARAISPGRPALSIMVRAFDGLLKVRQGNDIADIGHKCRNDTDDTHFCDHADVVQHVNECVHDTMHTLKVNE